ncbi:MAG: hypothetical protein FJ125_15450, partial [Deltaproteobacteria bacterium]|nr:hypothetical protein [Deltaproteobacteria bacterium]
GTGPAERICVQGFCVTPCRANGCPEGFVCHEAGCVPECAFELCPNDQICNPDTGACEDACIGVRCGAGRICQRGVCVEDNCYGRGCPLGQRCIDGLCLVDPCAFIACGPDEFCRDGECYRSCAGVSCPLFASCVDGFCVNDPCGGVVCPAGQRCSNGRCSNDPCVGRPCPAGRACIGGECLHDPCFNIECPEGQRCALGQCLDSWMPGEGEGEGEPCIPGSEVCNGEDDDCNDLVDDGARCLGDLECIGGSCTCRDESLTRCESWCVDTASDPGHCGGCDRPCVGGQVCAGGQCADHCRGALSLCGRSCVDLQTNPLHCGACDRACAPAAGVGSCQAGRCRLVGCWPGYGDLDGQPGNGCECRMSNDGLEACDGRDNDCDGQVDDLPVPGPGDACATGRPGACARGVPLCVDGRADCAARVEPGLELCNGIDDDCDGQIDERLRNACGECGPPRAEACNQEDDDCDGDTDEGADAACPAGKVCKVGYCVARCQAGGACPQGFTCLQEGCVPRCAAVPCAGGKRCNPQSGQCEDPCAGVACAGGKVCHEGRCVEDSCYGKGCPFGQRCVDGVCEADPCAFIACGPDEFCRDGRCVRSCAGLACPL